LRAVDAAIVFAMTDLLYTPVVKTARVMFVAMGMKLTSAGWRTLQGRGSARNQPHELPDFIFAGVPAADAGGRYVRFMAKDAVFHHKVSGPLMRGMKHIPVDRNAGGGAYAAAVEALRSGELVGVFPEATMSRSFDLKDFKTGAARMAADAGVPLIPEIVFGGQRIFSYHHKDLSSGKAISVHVGAALHPTVEDDMTEVTADLHTRMGPCSMRPSRLLQLPRPGQTRLVVARPARRQCPDAGPGGGVGSSGKGEEG
jgi:1-acyl-sn-glycerol-3-phosphate acyltransferase